MLSAESSTRAVTPSGRISYARIDKKVDGVSYEKFEIPNLIELQLDSFAWFVEKGLRELFDEISPIKDFTGKVMELQFLDYEFGDPKYSEEECRTKDLTFSKPLYVNVELLIKETGEIQRQRVYMGDYPWMTDQGTFVINGAERVVVGLPLTLRGEHGSQARETDAFVEALRAQLDVPVESYDERFTTGLAAAHGSDDAPEDARAAAHLLSSYLAWSSSAKG